MSRIKDVKGTRSAPTIPSVKWPPKKKVSPLHHQQEEDLQGSSKRLRNALMKVLLSIVTIGCVSFGLGSLIGVAIVELYK